MGVEMIKTHYDACRVLGIPTNACREQWKKTYHEICQKYHPDVCIYSNSNVKNAAEEYFILATKAYEFLEKEAQQSVVIPNQSSIDIITNRKSRDNGQKILGNTKNYKNGSYSGYENYQKRQALERQRREEEKQRKLEQLHEKSRLLKEQEQKKKEEEILNQIRWLRVASLIQKTIEEDRKRKDFN